MGNGVCRYVDSLHALRYARENCGSISLAACHIQDVQSSDALGRPGIAMPVLVTDIARLSRNVSLTRKLDHATDLSFSTLICNIGIPTKPCRIVLSTVRNCSASWILCCCV